MQMAGIVPTALVPIADTFAFVRWMCRNRAICGGYIPGYSVML